MLETLGKIQHDLGLSKALAEHFYKMLVNDCVHLPRMEIYRLRRALRKYNISILCRYGYGYHLVLSDRNYFYSYFNIYKNSSL